LIEAFDQQRAAFVKARRFGDLRHFGNLPLNLAFHPRSR
jgi:hypothetical protein